MAAENQSPPPPDAGGGISRRTLLKAGAGAATVGAITTRPGPLEDVEISPIGSADALAVTTGFIVAASVGVGSGVALGHFYGTKLQNYEEALDASIDTDQVLAHNAATSEMQTMNAEVVDKSNTLTRSRTMAHQEARHAIASAWESGKGSTEALSAAHDAIEAYYADPVERNWLTVTMKSLAQIGYAKQAGADALVNSGDSDYSRDNPWCGSLLNHPTYGDADWVEIIPAENEYEYTLADGSTVALATPDMKIEYDSSGVSSGDYETTISMGDWLAGHLDPSIDLDVQIDGEEVTWNGNISIPNVTNDDGDDLPSRVVMQLLNDFVDIRGQIRDQAQTVIDGYSQTLVDNIYAKLDAGEISPADVRGVDGQAAFMAGTEDASADAYIMSLMQQLGLEQADLSTIASMTVGYRGFTGLAPQTDGSGNREIFPADYTDSSTYRGQLYASEIPDSGLDAGATYVCGSSAYLGAAADGLISTSVDGSENWSFPFSSAVFDVAVSPMGQTLYAGGFDEVIKAISTSDGTERWSFTGHSGYIRSLSSSSDGSLLFSAADDETVKALSTSDGTEQWSFSGQSFPYATAVSPDDQTVYSGGDSAVKALSTSDGTEQWSVSPHSDRTLSVAVSPDGSLLFTASDDNTVKALSTSDGTEQWSFSGHSNSVNSVAVSPDGSLLFTASDDNTVKALSTSDGTEQWSFSGHSNSVNSVAVTPDGSRLVTGGDSGTVIVIDTGTNSETYSYAAASNGVNAVTIPFNPAVRPDLSISAPIEDASFYDAEGGQYVKLSGGLLTINQMTDQDGNTVETTDGSDWGAPEYDNPDIDQWIDYLLKSGDFGDALQSQYPVDDGLLSGGSTDSSWWPPDFWPSWLPSDPVGAAIVVILGIAGFNVATS